MSKRERGGNRYANFRGRGRFCNFAKRQVLVVRPRWAGGERFLPAAVQRGVTKRHCICRRGGPVEAEIPGEIRAHATRHGRSVRPATVHFSRQVRAHHENNRDGADLRPHTSRVLRPRRVRALRDVRDG